MRTLNDIIKANEAYVIDLRRYFRQHPELGGQEVKTQARIISELKAMGLEPRAAAGTGVIAEFQGTRPGKTIAIRADIDALPIADEVEQPYRSIYTGVCHACGHDGHTAMLLGVAKALTELGLDMPGTIRFLFQPREECFPDGAGIMIDEGALAGVTAIIGTHLWQPLPAGKLGIAYGRLMASPSKFTITVQGKGGHGSMPQQTIDALAAGAQIVVGLRSIVGNHVDPLEPAVLSVGMFQAGNAFNIISAAAKLEGTVRAFSSRVRDVIFERIDAVCRGVCETAGASYLLEPFYGVPAVVNQPEVAAVIAQTGREVLGESGVKEVAPVMIGEDFSCYLEKVPGAFMLLGAGNGDKGIVYPHHHPRFDIDETVLTDGVEIMARTALKLLKWNQ
ncbi:MAG: amidohydrolase [Veillonellales bacterium]